MSLGDTERAAARALHRVATPWSGKDCSAGAGKVGSGGDEEATRAEARRRVIPGRKRRGRGEGQTVAASGSGGGTHG